MGCSVEKRTQVVVYGSSIAMAGIAASLQADAGLDVVRLNRLGPTSQPSLDELNPAVIAFDLSDPPSGVDLTLLCERPGLLLVGVDPDSDELLIVSSRQRRAVSAADLLEAIDREIENRVGRQRRSCRPARTGRLSEKDGSRLECGGERKERQA